MFLQNKFTKSGQIILQSAWQIIVVFVVVAVACMLHMTNEVKDHQQLHSIRCLLY